MSQDHLSILVTRPIAVTILILAALTTITGIRRQRKALRQQAAMEAAASSGGAQG
jgi:TctA family transporter